jgi:hypothetical protein
MEQAMNRWHGTLLIGVCVASPAFSAETANPADAFAGNWARNSFNFEPMPGQPAPLVNLKRIADGTMDAGQIVGDYNNPLLKPEAAEIVRQKGEISKSGRPYPDPSNSCGPYQPPFTYAMELGMLYAQDDQVRRVRLNGTHPRNVKPSPMGDAVGHWEGDTLVVDIVGIQSFPYSMIDRYAVPVTKSTHIVERYRLIDGPAAKQAQDLYEKHEGRVGGVPGAMAIDPDVNLKGLQVEITVEDPTMYTRTWSATSTYRRGRGPWLEQVCAEDDFDPIEGKTRENIPQTKRADF